MSRNRLYFMVPFAGEFAYSRFVTGALTSLGTDPGDPRERVAGLLDLGIPRGRILSTAGIYLPEAHNGLIRMLLKRRDWDGVVWIEHDHQFDAGMVERMERYDKPVVGVPYYTRDLVDPRIMIAQWVNPDNPEDTDPPYKIEYVSHTTAMRMIAQPGLHEVDFVPHGMTFVRRDVYEKIGAPWYAAGDSKELGDDVYFIGQVHKAGFKVYCDTTLYSGHLAMGCIDHWWYIRERRREWLELQFGEHCPPLLGGADNARFLRGGLKEQMAEVAAKSEA